MGRQHQHRGHSHAPTTAVREERQPPQDDAVEMAPGILRVQLPISVPGLGHVNCYVLPDDRGVTVVDPGLPGPQAWKELSRRLSRADIPISRVHTVVVTHSHADHFGQAARLMAENDARVITHRSFRSFFDPDEEPDQISLDIDAPRNATVQTDEESVRRRPAAPWPASMPWGNSGGTDRRGRLKGPGRPPLKRRLQYRLMRLRGGHMHRVPHPTHRVEDAERIELGGRSWVSLHTPGHTLDHLCLFDPEAGILISGDHVLPTITPHISGIGETVDPLMDFFASLERVGELDQVTNVLPAHGLDFADLTGRAKAIIRHHEERLQLLRDASAEIGWATVPTYSTYMFAARSLGHMADSETYAHLEHLRLTGEAKVRDDGPDLLYAIG